MPPDTQLSFRGSAAATDEPRTRPPACVWLTEDRMAWRHGGVLEIRALPDLTMLDAFPLGARTLQACDDTGRYLLVTANASGFDEHGHSGLGCYDTVARAWLAEIPLQVVAAAFGSIENGAGAQLFEYRRGGRLDLALGDAMTVFCWARGNTAALLSGDRESLVNAQVRSTVDGMIEVAPHVFRLRELADVPVLEAPAVRARADRTIAAAMARHEGRWRFFLPTGHVADVDRTLFRIPFPVDAAAFSPDGARLLVLGEDAAIIDIASMNMVWRQSM